MAYIFTKIDPEQLKQISDHIKSEEDSRNARCRLMHDIITLGIPEIHFPAYIRFKMRDIVYHIDIDYAKEVNYFLLPRAQHREQPISANQIMKLGLAVQDLILLGKEEHTDITKPITISKAYGARFVDEYCDYCQRYIDKRNELLTWIWEHDFLRITPQYDEVEIVTFAQVYNWLYGEEGSTVRMVKI